MVNQKTIKYLLLIIWDFNDKQEKIIKISQDKITGTKIKPCQSNNSRTLHYHNTNRENLQKFTSYHNETFTAIAKPGTVLNQMQVVK